MGLATVSDRATGQTILAAHVNEIHQWLRGSFTGRNTSNAVESGKSLGTASIPWGTIYGTSLILAGSSIDTSQISAPNNRLISGKSRADSSQPQFLKANGAAPSVTLEGAATDLIVDVNGSTVTFSTDVVKGTLSVAPSANNTALVNDPGLTDQDFTKFLGEHGSVIPIDAAGSEITSLAGTYAAFKLGTEIFIGLINATSTEISNCFRGYFYDSTQTPIVRETLADNDTITLMKAGWVFGESTGTVIDVSFAQPQSQTIAPGSPSSGDFWLDITNNIWKKHDGIIFNVANATLLGLVIMDSTNAIATRSFDFFKQFDSFENIEIEKFSASILKTKKLRTRISVYGSDIVVDNDHIEWNTAADFESGVSETASTLYYLYLTEDAQGQISDQAPFDRRDLKGFYHPFHTWRFIGTVFNDASSDFEDPNDTQVAETSLIHGFKTVGAVGDLGQIFAGHRFELTEPGTTKAETLALYLFASGALETDEKGNNNLTAVNTPTNTTGILGETFATNLVAASSQHYTQATLLDVVPTAIAIDFWVKFDDGNPASENTIFRKQNIVGQDRIFVNLSAAGLFLFSTEQSNNGQKDLTIANLTNGVQPWHYVVVTWDVTNGKRAWFNGVQVAQDSSETTLMLTGTATDFFIGASTVPGSFLDGDLALFRVRDKILAQADVDIGYSSRLDLFPPLQGKDFDLHGTLRPGGNADFERGYPVSGLEVARNENRIYRAGGLITGLAATDTLKMKARF